MTWWAKFRQVVIRWVPEKSHLISGLKPEEEAKMKVHTKDKET